jgi:hypothetical protein
MMPPNTVGRFSSLAAIRKVTAAANREFWPRSAQRAGRRQRTATAYVV